MIDMRHNKTAQHEEHVNGEIAFVDQVSMRPNIEIRETLNTIVIEHHPQRGDAPTGGQRGQLLLPAVNRTTDGVMLAFASACGAQSALGRTYFCGTLSSNIALTKIIGSQKSIGMTCTPC